MSKGVQDICSQLAKTVEFGDTDRDMLSYSPYKKIKHIIITMCNPLTFKDQVEELQSAGILLGFGSHFHACALVIPKQMCHVTYVLLLPPPPDSEVYGRDAPIHKRDNCLRVFHAS